VPAVPFRDVAYDFSSYGQELWLATPQGATVASLPVDARSGATTYYKEISPILSDNILALTVGKESIRWFGTDRGISAFRNKKWLTNSYQRQYPESLFLDFPITAMASSTDGDSLYVATRGAGVARLYRSKTDAISGASEYAQWGPIELPSDSVYSICIEPDGTQWFGTARGVARHKGYKTLEGWKVFTKKDGLVNDFVTSISTDNSGNIWFGTREGISVYDGNTFRSITSKDGVPAEEIKEIHTDKKGVVWIITETAILNYEKGAITLYPNNK
jgi:ligand-binding sensor domain-containing protein